MGNSGRGSATGGAKGAGSSKGSKSKEKAASAKAPKSQAPAKKDGVELSKELRQPSKRDKNADVDFSNWDLDMPNDTSMINVQPIGRAANTDNDLQPSVGKTATKTGIQDMRPSKEAYDFKNPEPPKSVFKERVMGRRQSANVEDLRQQGWFSSTLRDALYSVGALEKEVKTVKGFEHLVPQQGPALRELLDLQKSKMDAQFPN